MPVPEHHTFRVIDVLAGVLAGVIGLIALRVFFVHINDFYWLNFVTGAWLAQVNEALHGVPYPKLFDGERVGGTRFMVIPIALHAALAWVLDTAGMARPEALIVAGRIMSLLATAGLLYVIYRVALRFGAPHGFAALVAAAVLLTSPGQLPLHSIRYDAPSVALQLAALLWATSKRPRWIWIGVLLGVAVFCKANAIWAGLGLTVWLLFTDRRGLGQLYLGGTASVALIALAAHFWTGGRIWENLLGLTFGGGDDPKRGWIGSLQAIADYWMRFAKLSMLLLPLSLIGWVALARQWREGGPFVLAACWAMLVAWYSYNDVGVSYNHLLNLLVLVSVGVAAAAGWARHQPRWVYAGTYAMLILVSLAAVATGHMTREALQPGNSHEDLTVEMKAAVDSIPPPDGQPIFSDDSFFPIMVGERPMVMDTFMLHRISRRDPAAMQFIIAQIDDQAYRAVVVPPTWFDETAPIDPELVKSITTRYRPLDASKRIVVMVPRTENKTLEGTP